MTDIKEHNVRTYVEGLIKKEFSSKNNKEKALSDKCKTNTDELAVLVRRDAWQGKGIGGNPLGKSLSVAEK